MTNQKLIETDNHYCWWKKLLCNCHRYDTSKWIDLHPLMSKRNHIRNSVFISKRFLTIQSFIVIRRIIFLKSYVTLFLKRHCIGMVHFLDMYFMYLCKLIICHFIALFFCFRCGCQMQKTLIEAFFPFIQPVQVSLWNVSSKLSRLIYGKQFYKLFNFRIVRYLMSICFY